MYARIPLDGNMYTKEQCKKVLALYDKYGSVTQQSPSWDIRLDGKRSTIESQGESTYPNGAQPEKVKNSAEAKHPKYDSYAANSLST